MVVEWLQNLLILQDRDQRCDGIQRQLDDIPGQIKREETNIAALTAKLAELQKELKSMEVRRLDLEGEVEQAEATIMKYKTQQLQVKKNEEYSALEHEITALKDHISELEDSELVLMEEIDQKSAIFDESKEKIGHDCKTLEAHISLLKENHASFASELDNARDAVTESEATIDSAILQQYKYVKGQVKRPPYVVELDGNRCNGCHLKVSGEVETLARKGKELVRCDSCGRILYFDR
ncbi:MAG: zinc ribbon domain-containing protein [Puniceicoccaceae bacterium]